MYKCFHTHNVELFYKKAKVFDKCLKHSDYTRVGLTFSGLFYIYLRSFCGWIPDLVIGVYAGEIGTKRAAFGSNFRAAEDSA